VSSTCLSNATRNRAAIVCLTGMLAVPLGIPGIGAPRESEAIPGVRTPTEPPDATVYSDPGAKGVEPSRTESVLSDEEEAFLLLNLWKLRHRQAASVRASAAVAIGRLGRKAAYARPDLCDALLDPDLEVRTAAVDALRKVDPHLLRFAAMTCDTRLGICCGRARVGEARQTSRRLCRSSEQRGGPARGRAGTTATQLVAGTVE
jgi:hypothetical protein